jgi:HTH-type transcriptional repressor of NAD biosynthesis genes
MAQVARICLIGPHSTGKSTLAAELAAHYGREWVAEYAREYALAVGRELAYEDVVKVAVGQAAAEARASDVAILDTDLLSTDVYSRFYYGRSPVEVRRFADLYLLMNVDTPFVADPARDSADAREELFARFRAALEEHGANFVVISGDWDARREAAIRAIDAYAAR